MLNTLLWRLRQENTDDSLRKRQKRIFSVFTLRWQRIAIVLIIALAMWAGYDIGNNLGL